VISVPTDNRDIGIASRKRQALLPAPDPDNLRPLMGLLKALWKLRPPGSPEAPAARLVRRWREKRLLVRLERRWPGGFALHRTGDLVYVPSPLDARGRHALLHPPLVHPAVNARLPSGGVAIDIGANLGEWTVPLAHKVGPAGHLLAIEPAPRSAAALGKTIAANGLRQAELVCCALGEDDGIVDFAVPLVTSARSDTGTAHIGPAAAREETLRVTVRRLDGLVAQRGYERIDLIKIDVEGHERRVLDGAAAVLARFRPVLVIETGHEAEDDRIAIHDRLTGLGYRILGIPLDHGMADADWPAYRIAGPPFCRGRAHNLLLVPG
jgi:FkbM family methyltransferase